MNLVIRKTVDARKNKSEYEIGQMVGKSYTAKGKTCTSKAKAIAYCRALIYSDDLIYYPMEVIFWTDTEQAWNDGTWKKNINIHPGAKPLVLVD